MSLGVSDSVTPSHTVPHAMQIVHAAVLSLLNSERDWASSLSEALVMSLPQFAGSAFCVIHGMTVISGLLA